MKEFKFLKFSKQNHIALLTINHPQALNALNGALLDELDEIIAIVERDEDIYVLVITGEGRAFVAGADISEMLHLDESEGKLFSEKGAGVFRKIELLNQPVIAAVNGFALGGGCELALACDFRIASSKARFGQPETGLGITPGFFGTYRLVKAVGAGYAKEMIYSASVIDAEEALRIELVNKVFSQESLMEEVMKIADAIVSKAPLAVRYSKKAINESDSLSATESFNIEAGYFGKCFATEDQKEGMSAFLEKRSARFNGK